MTHNPFWSTPTPSQWSVQPGLAVLQENRHKNDGLVESQVLSLSYGHVVVKPIEKQRGLVPDSYEGYQILDPGDIVVRPTDLQNDQTSIRVGHVKDRGIITSAYIGLRPAGAWSDSYAYQYLSVVDSSKRIYGMGSGLRQQLGWSDLKRMPCLAPSAEEQAAIVKYLAHANARIDKAIAAKRRIIALLDEHRAVVQAHLLLGAAGTTARLKDFATVQTGLTLGKDYGGKHLTSYPYLRVANVQMGSVDTSTVAQVAVPEPEVARFSLQPGDVLMTEGGDIDKLGRGTVWDGHIEPCLHQNHVFAVRCKDELKPEFLAAWLAGPISREYFYLTAKKTTNLASTNSTTLGKLPITVPPRVEQDRLLEAIHCQTSPMIAAIDKAERENALLREFRTRLVADVVTGQVDVRAIAATLPDAPESFDNTVSATDDDLEEALSEGEE
jgi:type I restriction enzyme S subunit